jgi:hypothetical protein
MRRSGLKNAARVVLGFYMLGAIWTPPIWCIGRLYKEDPFFTPRWEQILCCVALISAVCAAVAASRALFRITDETLVPEHPGE